LAVRDALAQLSARLCELLDEKSAVDAVTDVHATVTAVVPNSVPVRAARRPEL
jgi:hypothetical protein